MSKKYIIITFFLLMASFAFWSCSENLFGSPAGESSKSNCGSKDIDCLQVEAEEFFRNGKYSLAYENYEKIVKEDSTRSAGYFGMAKSALWHHGFTVFDLADFLNGGEDIGNDAAGMIKFFQTKVPSELNRYLQGSKKAFKALSELHRRDSLTAKCNNRKSCIDAMSESDKSDMKYSFETFNTSLVLVGTFKTILGNIVFDTWGNGCIFNLQKEVLPTPLEYGCDFATLKGADFDGSIFTFSEDGTPQLDLDKIYGDLIAKDGTINEGYVNDLNERMDELATDMGSLVDLLNSTSGQDGGGGGDLQQKLDDYKEYTLFYKIHDEIDNDGDGCIDEEIFIDGKGYDLDGDGVAGEDSKLVFIPDSKEDPNGPFYACYNLEPGTYLKICTFNPTGDEKDLLTMTVAKLAGLSDTTVSVAWANDLVWVPSYKNLGETARMDLKKRIQTEKDINGIKKCYTLQERKTLIGGCWNNLSPIDYTNLLKKRELIGDRNPECNGSYL